jgi:hypothetical protein
VTNSSGSQQLSPMALHLYVCRTVTQLALSRTFAWQPSVSRCVQVAVAPKRCLMNCACAAQHQACQGSGPAHALGQGGAAAASMHASTCCSRVESQSCVLLSRYLYVVTTRLAVAHLLATLVSAAANSQLSALLCRMWGCLDKGAARALTTAVAGFAILVTLL